MGIATISLANGKLSGYESGVVWTSAENVKKELDGVTMEVNGDRVTLESPQQTLKFRTNGKEATVIDKLDNDRAYNLDAEGDFLFDLGGYKISAQPSSEGTLVTPGREVNPLLPLNAFLPRSERNTDPTPRTPEWSQGLEVATSVPWVAGLATTVAGLFFTEFTPAVALGAVGMMTCHFAHRLLERANTRTEAYQIPGLGALKSGEVMTTVMRNGKPGAGSSKGSSFTVERADLTLRSGLKLESDPALLLSQDSDSWSFEGASMVFEDQSIKIEERSGHLYRIRPDGSLHTETQGKGEPTEFASVYEVTRSQEQSLETDFGFEENEVVIDDFRLNYDH